MNNVIQKKVNDKEEGYSNMQIFFPVEKTIGHHPVIKAIEVSRKPNIQLLWIMNKQFLFLNNILQRVGPTVDMNFHYYLYLLNISLRGELFKQTT